MAPGLIVLKPIGSAQHAEASPEFRGCGLLNAAGGDRAAEGARSVAGDPNTTVVDKGATTATILKAPAGAGKDANASTPQ